MKKILLAVCFLFCSVSGLMAQSIQDYMAAWQRQTANPFKGVFSDWEHGQKTHQEAIEWLVECYVKAAVADAPESDPKVIRNMLQAFFLQRFPKIAPEEIPDQPQEDAWEEMWRIECLAVNRRAEEAVHAAQELFREEGNPPALKLLLCDFLESCYKNEGNSQYYHSLTQKAAEEMMTAERPRAPEAALWSYNILANSEDCGATYFQDLVRRLTPMAEKLDPWFWEMVQGQANITDAWDSRGGGYADTVSEEGWKGFDGNLQEARKHFEAALAIHPERPNPYIALITVYMGLSCGPDDAIRAFKQLLKVDPENVKSYGKILWAMRPRWGGSLELGRFLALEALRCPRRDTRIPALGYQCLADIASDYGENGWQKAYLDPEVRKACDDYFSQLEERYRKNDSYNRLIPYLFLRKMALQEYDEAAKLMEQRDCLKAIQDSGWSGPYVHWKNPDSTPSFDDLALRYRLFTGKYARELREAEKKLMADAEDEEAFRILRELIAKGEFTLEERDYLFDFYGRWRMNISPYCYRGGGVNGKGFLDVLVVARQREFNDVAAELLEMGYNGAEHEDFPGQAAYRIACSGSFVEQLEILKNQGVPLDAPAEDGNGEGATPIHGAAWNNHPEMIQELVRLGVPIELPSRNGHTALHLAASSRSMDAVRMLLKLGADPNAPDFDGDTCLIYLPQVHADRKFYQLFLEQPSIDVNRQNRAGDAPLHYMARFETPVETARLLLDHGADVNLRNGAGRTPLDCAEQAGHGSLAELLRVCGGLHGADMAPARLPVRFWKKYTTYVMAALLLLGIFIVVACTARRHGR